MRIAIKRLIRSEVGQDLIEYSLILAFVVLVGAALYIGMSQSIRGLWTITNSRLSNANMSAS